MRNILIISTTVLSLFCWSCQTSKTTNQDNVQQETEEVPLRYVEAQKYNELQLAEGLSYQVLFQSGDMILAPNGKKVRSKENLDCVVLIPNKDDTSKAKLFVSFETKVYDQNLGSGGGGMIADLVYKNDKWEIVGMPVGVDYNPVGQTMNNCGGKETPSGTILSAEEFYTDNKQELYNVLRDTSDFNGRPITENFGWMVEIDPNTGKALRKLTSFGRYAHEDAVCMPDGKTVYISNDQGPAALFKFIADEPNNYQKGKLFAYSETEKWIALPNDYESLVNIRSIAFSRGATLFTRHEWLTVINNKLYITETGNDSVSYGGAIAIGGKLPSYYKDDALVQDPFGRVLVLDLATDELSVELEGGSYDGMMFSNPDCMTSYSHDGHDYLMLNEDIIGYDKGRSDRVEFSLNDVYRYDLGSKELKKIARSPAGSETTGGVFDAYGNYFLNIQHPSSSNKAPFNKSTLIVVTGIVK